MKYFVYIVECSDKSYYTGVSNNVPKRIDQHNSGADPKAYTHLRRPVELKFTIGFNDIREALLAEKQIKKWTRKKKEALINGDFDLLKKLSECQNETHYMNKNKRRK